MFTHEQITAILPKSHPRWRLPRSTIYQQKIWCEFHPVYNPRWKFSSFFYPHTTEMRTVVISPENAEDMIRSLHIPLVTGPDDWNPIPVERKWNAERMMLAVWHSLQAQIKEKQKDEHE